MPVNGLELFTKRVDDNTGLEQWGPVSRDNVLVWPTSIARDKWYRLVPPGMFEQAEIFDVTIGADAVEGDGQPIVRPVLLDQKLTPLYDVFATRHGVFVSERLAHLIKAILPEGVRTQRIAHVTNRDVLGHVAYELATGGFTGPVAQDQPAAAMVPIPNDVNPRIWGRTPVGAVTFDGGSGWTGDHVCWTPWFGSGNAEWRALVVSGALLCEIVATFPDLRCGVVEVCIVGASVSSLSTSAKYVEHQATPRIAPPDVRELVGRLKREAEVCGHVVHQPISPRDANHVSAECPFALPDEYLEVLSLSNGLDAFRVDVSSETDAGALRMWSAGAGSELSAAQREYRKYGYDSWVEGWFGIGESSNGGVVWTINDQGLVRGAGKEGIQYGPDAPFARWLSDQIEDCSQAWRAHAEGEPWGLALLTGRI